MCQCNHSVVSDAAGDQERDASNQEFAVDRCSDSGDDDGCAGNLNKQKKGLKSGLVLGQALEGTSDIGCTQVWDQWVSGESLLYLARDD